MENRTAKHGNTTNELSLTNSKAHTGGKFLLTKYLSRLMVVAWCITMRPI